jgi:hypothetical protein
LYAWLDPFAFQLMISTRHLLFISLELGIFCEDEGLRFVFYDVMCISGRERVRDMLEIEGFSLEPDQVIT